MKPRLYVGPGGAGKTQRLLQRYHQLANQHNTDSVLVLVWNARDVGDWREKVDLPWAGPLHVYTYFGWVQREIRRHWLRLGNKGKQWLEPEFLTVETGQFAMLRHIRQAQADFAGLVTSPERLAIQLGSCLVLASLNGIPRQEIGTRLAAAMPDRTQYFTAAQQVMDKYCDQLEQSGALDYGLAVALYSQLLADDGYRQGLRQYQHLLVDDADELSPAAQDFIQMMLEWVNSAALTFSTDGGHAGFFGADASRAWQRFGPRGQVELVRPHRTQYLALSGAIRASLIAGSPPQSSWQGPSMELIHEDLRSELLDRVGERVVQLVKAGTPPAEIAVLAPQADKVLEHALNLQLSQQGIPLNVLAKNRRLIDEPYVRVMMTLALLAHPHWELDWGVPDLAQSLQLLLKLDPVRAWFVSRQIHSHKLPVLEVWQRERLGFRAAQGYDLLRQWVEEYRNGPEQPIDIFFQRVFGELLSRLPPARDDLVVCRQLIVSAGKFLGTARRLPDMGESSGAAFIRMLTAGTVAAESLLEPATQQRAVMLTTPYAYLSGHHQSQVQIWLDCSSGRWFQQDAREIINPHVLKASWPQHASWTDEENEKVSLTNGARVARALVRRCHSRLIVTAANIDSRGFEQDGQLLERIFAAGGGEEKDAFSTRSK